MNEILRKLIKGFFHIIHKEISEEAVQGLVQFVKFCVVGLTNTLISYGLNVLTLLLLKPLGLTWDYIVGNIVAFVLSVLWSFYWNNRFVFTMQENKTRSVGKALVKTYIAYGFTGILLNNILSWLWISVLGISKFVAPLLNLVIALPINFLLNKLWAFKVEEK